MGTIVSTLFISLDGVAEIGETWHFPYFDDAMGRAVSEDYEGVETPAARAGHGSSTRATSTSTCGWCRRRPCRPGW